jgi:hypothetical protein
MAHTREKDPDMTDTHLTAPTRFVEVSMAIDSLIAAGATAAQDSRHCSSFNTSVEAWITGTRS